MANTTGARCDCACHYCFFLKKERLYPGYSLPMTYFIDGIRGLTLKGTTVVDEWRNFLALFTFMVGFTILSLARFRKTLT